MARILAFFTAPHPVPTGLGSIKVGLIYGLFVAVFLAVFRPFGMASFGMHGLWVAAVFGLVSFVVVALFQVGMHLLRFVPAQAEKWVVWKEIVATLVCTCLVGFANAATVGLMGFEEWRVGLFLDFQIYTLAVGAIPIVASISISQAVLKGKNMAYSQGLKEIADTQGHLPVDETQPVTLENGRESFVVKADAIRFFKAADNYVEVHWLDAARPQKTLIRNTLNKIESQLASNAHFVRCHKSYIVNLAHVQDILGNAQGCRILLDVAEWEVPVSRSYIPAVKRHPAVHP